MKRKFVLGPIVYVIWCVVLHIHLTLNNHCWCIELFSFLLFFEKQYSIKKVFILLFNHERPREWLISMPAISPTSYLPRSRTALSCTRTFVFFKSGCTVSIDSIEFLKGNWQIFGFHYQSNFDQLFLPRECVNINQIDSSTTKQFTTNGFNRSL